MLHRFFRWGIAFYQRLGRLGLHYRTARHINRFNQLGQLALVALITWLSGANLLYYTEKHFNPGAGPFADYGQSYWNIIIVLLSGIEDKEPLSLIGRVEVTVFLLAGVCMVALITGLIVAILVRRIQRAGYVTLKPPDGNFEDHIVILGTNKHLDSIIRQLHAAKGESRLILIVGEQARRLLISDSAVYRNVFALEGDPLDPAILMQADLSQAHRVIVLATLDNDLETSAQRDNQTLMTAIAVHSRNPKLPMVVEVLNDESLRLAAPLDGVEFVLSRHFGEKLAAQAALNPGVTEIYYQLMNYHNESSEFYTIPIPRDLVGRTFKSAKLYYLDADEHPVVLVGIDRSPEDQPGTVFVLNPGSPVSGLPQSDLVLRTDDRLIVIANDNPAQSHQEELALFSFRRSSREYFGDPESFWD